MAKFTVYFKNKVLCAGVFESGIVHIGRDETNDLVVDSLAVAPVHAVAVIKEGNCYLKQMNDKFPLLINNRQMKECNLADNDVVNIGKHYIVYNTAASVVIPGDYQRNNDLADLNEKLKANLGVQDANLQVLEGEHIGRIVPLKKALTRLGNQSGGVVVIARRKDGYFVSALQENENLTVNGEALGNKIVKLNDNDVISMDNIPMQFFLG
jgi:pSer/pThr/pTyr-binding forkhead associated (FHA) protein